MDSSPLDADPPSLVADPDRLEALRETGLLDSPADPLFDRLTALTARLLEVPTALVSLVDLDRQFFKSSFGLLEPWRSRRETPLSHSFCRHLVGDERVFEVTDARVDRRVKDSRAVPELGVVAYLGVPLHGPGGQNLGALCAIDGRPREWTPQQLASLRELAGLVEGAIEERVARRQFEDRLRAYEVLLERIPNASMALFDRDLRYVLVRGAHLFGQLGISPESLQGRLASEVLSPENRERMLGAVPRRPRRKRGAPHLALSRSGLRRPDRSGSRRSRHDYRWHRALTRRDRFGGFGAHPAGSRTAWLESVLEAMDDAVVVMNKGGEIILANEVGRQLVESPWPNAASWP